MSASGPDFWRGGAEDVRMVAQGWRWGRRSLVPRGAAGSLAPYEPSVFPTRWARRKPARVLREVVQRGVLDPLLRSQTAPEVSGLDVLAGVEPPVVFVANHSSHLDTPLILCSLPDRWRRRTAVAAAADYFFDTWWRAAGSAIAFNTFPIERRGGSLSSTPGELLRDGWNVVVYPEGTRSRDGWVARFRLGAAWLATEHAVPVVPVAIRGAFAAMPRGSGWPRPGRPPVSVRFGRAVRPAADESPRSLAPRVTSAMAQLLDEDASSWWEAQRRAAAGRTPDPGGPDVATWRRVWEQSEPPRVAAGREPIWR